MTRKQFLVALSALFGANLQAQKPQKKFYITGFGSCEPALESFGASRGDALLHCCNSGGLTVWTEEEWKDFRSRLGKQFDESCKASKEARNAKD